MLLQAKSCRFPILLSWFTLFLSTELWNVFRGCRSRCSGAVSEAGMKRPDLMFHLDHLTSPYVFVEALNLISLHTTGGVHSLSHAIMKNCQISPVQLIEDTFPPLCTFSINHVYVMYFFISCLWLLLDFLPVWQTAVLLSVSSQVGTNRVSN